MTGSDDGFSGGNFERPAWKRLIEEVEAGNVATIIAKDMSRIGREYLQTGWYTEIFFREHGVRFIAIGNGVDSDDHRTEEFTPFLNLVNDFYSRDTSKKIRAVVRAKSANGKHIGKAPYGYLADPNDKGKWIVDEEAAAVVRRIFDMTIAGMGPSEISRILEFQRMPIARALYAQRKGQPMPENPFFWPIQSVTVILGRVEYTGCACNFKTFSKSYKELCENIVTKRVVCDKIR